MEISAAKAFNEFVLDARNAFDCVFNRNITEKEQEQIKATYTVKEIERYRAEFDDELFRNHIQYMDDELLYEYVRMNVEMISEIKFITTKTDILRNATEVSFLVSLMKAIEEQRSFINSLMKTEFHYDADLEEDFIFYSNLSNHLGEISLASNCVDGLGKIVNEVKNMPPKDSRFNFEFIIVECNLLKKNTERIKLITARLYEFEQWKIQNERVDNGLNYTITDYHKLLYPNFEKLCKVEIEKLEKLIKLENDLPYNVLPEKIAPEIVDKSGSSDYIWKSSATDLLELAAALYQNKSVERRDGKDMTRKELIEYFQALFNIEINDIEGKLSKASGRNNNTAFLDNLSQQFRNYVAGKEAKMVKRR
jgi:hypothetical protein